jgi:hypothetical protein
MSDAKPAEKAPEAKAPSHANRTERKAVQLALGQAMVHAFQAFALKKIESVEKLETTQFAHVRDAGLRKRLAETLHGARWLYKLGLVTLATNEQRAAHVRAQLIDYGAICEAILLDAIAHGIIKKRLIGIAWRTNVNNKPIAWSEDETKIWHHLRRKPFEWLINVAKDEKIVAELFAVRLHWLRQCRNDVHIAKMATVSERTGLGESRKAFGIMNRCVRNATTWISANP